MKAWNERDDGGQIDYSGVKVRWVGHGTVNDINSKQLGKFHADFLIWYKYKTDYRPKCRLTVDFSGFFCFPHAWHLILPFFGFLNDSSGNSLILFSTNL